MSFYNRGGFGRRSFGDDWATPDFSTPAPDASAYTGPGSPGYQYSSPDQIAAAQVGETYVQPAVAPMEYVTSTPQTLPAAQPAYQSSSSSGGAGDFFSSLVGGIFGTKGTPTLPTPVAAAPSWILPVALGIGALAIVATVISTRSRAPLAGRGKRRRSKR